MMDEKTTLGDLLELQLHRVEEEVKNIVDKAVKEMAIEKVVTAPDTHRTALCVSQNSKNNACICA